MSHSLAAAPAMTQGAPLVRFGSGGAPRGHRPRGKRILRAGWLLAERFRLPSIEVPPTAVGHEAPSVIIRHRPPSQYQAVFSVMRRSSRLSLITLMTAMPILMWAPSTLARLVSVLAFGCRNATAP